MGKTNAINSHECADLGLSVKWATCNVGASRPEESGDFYAWGETETKPIYNGDNCGTREKGPDDISGTSLDAAHVKWHAPWRMPTVAEFEELRTKCTWTWKTNNGTGGYEVTSKKNGNSIFLPAAGRRTGTTLHDAGDGGFYWCSSPHGYTFSACYLRFFSDRRSTIMSRNEDERACGMPLRPVCGNKTSRFRLF